ncbi:hypothetical protein DKT68_13415 [Micromonospora acroterricola]|uniref:Uncharacterized protein n=1 Tax=Micromonospora acroterricola TaxID=2202421 RepID=A0A317D8M8_9ACTN|nr:hypothetical protein [Micromonospora acroterricola]PWR08985.1 hypothetical protein DKT68_13415 [Micromonospora acroterricola]
MTGLDPVREAVHHFLRHWEPRSAASLMAKAELHLDRLGIPGGRSAKALSAWKAGRQRPLPETLLVLRDVVGCKCRDEYSAFPLYGEATLTAMLTTSRSVDADLTAADLAAVDRVVALSSAAAEDCDVVADGFRLSDVYVRRDVEQTIVELIRPRSLIALRGEAGYGKTALMWHLHQRLGEAGRLALLIPATALLRGARGDRDAGAVSVSELWTALRAMVRHRRDPVLLVDTIDLLTHSEETRVEVRRLMRTAVECRVPMVVACRPAEAALLHLDQDGDESYGVPIRPMYLSAFNERERREAIESYAWAAYPDDGDAVIAVVQDAQVRGRPLREVVANPLTLRMLFELHAGDGERPDSDVDSIGLYNLTWQRRVVTDRRDRATPGGGPDLSRDVEQTALAMLSAGRIALRRSELTAWLDGIRPVDEALALLVGRALVTQRRESPWLWFWHQTWFEYTAARAIARRGERTAAMLGRFVAEEPYDLFYGEVASQLVLLAGRTPLVERDTAERLLAAWLVDDSPGLPALALRTYARFREPSAELRAHAAGALRAADDRVTKDFLRLLPSVSHPDAERWSSDLAVAWERVKARLVVLDALTRMAAADPWAARRFVIEHGCVDWLLSRPVKQWRDHDGPHLRLLSAVAGVDPRWAAEQAMRFWQPLAAEGIVGGLADIVAFVARHDPAGGTPGEEHRRTIAAALLTTPSDESTAELQVAYADLVTAADDLPADPEAALHDTLRDDTGGETWRRACLRVVGRAALTLPEPDAFLATLLDTGNPAEASHRATVLAELLRGRRGTVAEPPITRLVRVASRLTLGSGEADAARVDLFVTAIRYARLDGAELARIVPDVDADPRAWFGQLHPLLVEVAATGGGGAEAALRWAITDEAAEYVSARQLRDLGSRLRDRVENAPRLLTYLVGIAQGRQATRRRSRSPLTGYPRTCRPTRPACSTTSGRCGTSWWRSVSRVGPPRGTCCGGPWFATAWTSRPSLTGSPVSCPPGLPRSTGRCWAWRWRPWSGTPGRSRTCPACSRRCPDTSTAMTGKPVRSSWDCCRGRLRCRPIRLSGRITRLGPSSTSSRPATTYEPRRACTISPRA